jgi:hypothetical protein
MCFIGNADVHDHRNVAGIKLVPGIFVSLKIRFSGVMYVKRLFSSYTLLEHEGFELANELEFQQGHSRLLYRQTDGYNELSLPSEVRLHHDGRIALIGARLGSEQYWCID